jgi:hypothetical protein
MSNTEIKIENVEMDIMSVEPAEASNTEMLKEIQAKLEKLSLSDRQKIMVYLVSSMSKDVRKASKLLEKEDAKPKRKSAHLEIHRDWAAFVLAHAQQHGWPAFEVEKVKKDKSVTTDRYSESIHKDGKFIFADSLEKPKQISSSIAAQLAKFYWRSKENVGTNKALYDEFIAKRPVKDESESAESADSDSVSASASSSTTSSPKKKKLTDEEKEAKKNADKATKDAEKLKKQMDREMAKKKKEEEERQKLLAKLEQVGKPKPKSPKKTEVPAAAVAASPATSSTTPASPIVKRVVAKKTKEAKEEFKDDFVPSDPTGEEFDDWTHTDELGNTKQYMRNALNEIAEEQDGENVIIGTYDPKTNKIIMD